MNSVSIVLGVRQDVYDTPGGLRQMGCVCSGPRPCLYHWYYEVKGGNPPKEEYLRGAVPDRGPGTGSVASRKNTSARKISGVRGDDQGNGDRPRKTSSKNRR